MAIHSSILAWKIPLTEAPWGQKELERRVTQHTQETINERDRKDFFLKKKKKFRRFRAGTSQGNAPRPSKPGSLIWGSYLCLQWALLRALFLTGGFCLLEDTGGPSGDMSVFTRGRRSVLGGQVTVLLRPRISRRLALDSQGQ